MLYPLDRYGCLCMSLKLLPPIVLTWISSSKKNLSFQKLWIGSQGEIVYLRSHSLALNSSWGRFKALSLIFVFLLSRKRLLLGVKKKKRVKDYKFFRCIWLCVVNINSCVLRGYPTEKKKARWEAKKEGRYCIVQLSSIKKMEPFLKRLREEHFPPENTNSPTRRWDG